MEWMMWFITITLAQRTQSDVPPMATTPAMIRDTILMLSLIPISGILGHFWYKRTEDRR